MRDLDPVHGTQAQRWGGWHWQPPQRCAHFRRCSYCDSMNPDDLAAEQGWHAEWADRKYGWPHKFYIDIPNRTPDALFCTSSSSGGEPQPGMVPAEQLTPEQRAIIIRDGMGRDGAFANFYGFGTREHHYGKFYTVHLADPQISDETKEQLYRVSGLRFTFTDGRVAWGPYPQEVPDA